MLGLVDEDSDSVVGDKHSDGVEGMDRFYDGVDGHGHLEVDGREGEGYRTEL